MTACAQPGCTREAIAEYADDNYDSENDLQYIRAEHLPWEPLCAEHAREFANWLCTGIEDGYVFAVFQRALGGAS